MRRKVWVLLTFVVLAILGGCGSKGGGGEASSSSVARVERALELFSAAVQDGAPVVNELDRALAARLSAADATVIIRQYVRLIEAANRHEDMVADPEFLALMQRLGDLPYFDEFAAALETETQSSALVLGAEPGPLETARLPLSGKVKCSTDCTVDPIMEYAAETGLSLLGTFFGTLDLVISGTGCVDQLMASYSCLAQDQCGRVDLARLGVSCLQVGGTLATEGEALAVVGVVRVVGATAGALVARRSVTKAVEECESYQAANCCQTGIPCGPNCCAQGLGCQVGGICARNATAGCADDEKPCGLYCCPANSLCDSDALVCRWPAHCEAPLLECGSDCCSVSQTCGMDGHCQACSDELCGGTVCCPAGSFCNSAGQCIKERDGGCGPVCGLTCCAPGQSCPSSMDGDCQGVAAQCPDGTCSEGVETPLICPADCPSLCPDTICQDWETPSTCPEDCAGTAAPEPEEDVSSDVSEDQSGSQGCPSFSGCAAFCEAAEEKAISECIAGGGTVLTPFDSAACQTACSCLDGKGCGGLLPCVFNRTCDGCDALAQACGQMLYDCSWGDWMDCGI